MNTQLVLKKVDILKLKSFFFFSCSLTLKLLVELLLSRQVILLFTHLWFGVFFVWYFCVCVFFWGGVVLLLFGVFYFVGLILFGFFFLPCQVRYRKGPLYLVRLYLILANIQKIQKSCLKEKTNGIK